MDSMDLRGGRQKSSQDVNCPICFTKFRDQVLGYPNGCQHRFCFDCIFKWSANSNDCPVDRLPFHNIKIVHKGNSINTLDMKSNKKKRKMAQRYDFTTFCEVCRSRDLDELLSCNACDLAYHTFCLKPTSQPKPGCAFYCDDCSMILSRKRKRELVKSESSASPRKAAKSVSSESDLFSESSESSFSQNASAEDPSCMTDQESECEISSPSASWSSSSSSSSFSSLASSSSSLASSSSSSASMCISKIPMQISELRKRLTINRDGSLFLQYEVKD